MFSKNLDSKYLLLNVAYEATVLLVVFIYDRKKACVYV